MKSVIRNQQAFFDRNLTLMQKVESNELLLFL